MKVLLVYPRFKYPTGDPPLGILYVASYLREAVDDIDVRLFDATFNPSMDALRSLIVDFMP
ncbi:MAG: hypothetical protein ACTSUK_00505, partial [Promethearchaeota archaeon]